MFCVCVLRGQPWERHTVKVRRTRRTSAVPQAREATHCRRKEEEEEGKECRRPLK